MNTSVQLFRWHLYLHCRPVSNSCMNALSIKDFVWINKMFEKLRNILTLRDCSYCHQQHIRSWVFSPIREKMWDHDGQAQIGGLCIPLGILSWTCGFSHIIFLHQVIFSFHNCTSPRKVWGACVETSVLNQLTVTALIKQQSDRSNFFFHKTIIKIGEAVSAKFSYKNCDTIIYLL